MGILKGILQSKQPKAYKQITKNLFKSTKSRKPSKADRARVS